MDDPRIEEIRGLLPQAMIADWVRLGARLVRVLRDARHRGNHGLIIDRLLARARASVALREQRRATHPAPNYPPDLPISVRRAEIVEAIRQHQVVVIAGQTGSGKTTQIPKMCLEAGLGIEAKIGVTQPRRVAAVSISKRIAEELHLTWGVEVGCKIRFDDRSSPYTRIKLMTDGILLAEAQGDPLLTEYNALIIDEAHERSLNIDFLLGLLKGLIFTRKDLKVIITSATIDTQAFSKAFDNAPILEVSGRLFPVEEVYLPLDVAAEENGDLTYVDAAVRATEQVLTEPGDGDVLIFMPGERDIRETGELLRNRVGITAEVIPLYGRLSAVDQERVFAAAAKRKVVIATNIAETSLTIPGIRFVIDTGLARISRYNPRTRTRRLPIEPISQSSANQRKGRSGRVRQGLCIRLYSAADYASRPAFTQPEIQRSNLAEVILRMKAFRLGEIETFPFVNPPSPGAVQGGYALLQELGALDENRELTKMGWDLARLPIDPALGRMVIQAQQEHATREILIIAAGLSIQDPRERPPDEKQAAQAVHQRFVDSRSDFLTLLNLWNAVHAQWESLGSQNQRRKFCRAHFLSYLRMREWQDLHTQLHESLQELGTVRLNDSNAAYEAIHRSIISGLLGHVAFREARNEFKASGNRTVRIFPGSALFERGGVPKSKTRRGHLTVASTETTSQPQWIVAGEVVETSQVFVRTVAGIDPAWIVQLAPHLCKTTYHNPHWSPEAGQVMAEERMTFNGLGIRRRDVAYGNVNPLEASMIFVRGALVEENLQPVAQRKHRDRSLGTKPSSQSLLDSIEVDEPCLPTAYAFLEYNRRIRHKVETWQTRTRQHDLPDLDDALTQFYMQHLSTVSSLHQLNRFLRGSGNPERLRVCEKDLVGDRDLTFDEEAFPDRVSLEGKPVALSYAYRPGEELDGVTIRMGFDLASRVPASLIEWAVPGMREAQINELLRALPKSYRRELQPMGPKAREIVKNLKPGGASIKHDVAQFIQEHYGVRIPITAWPTDALPAYLQPRVEVLGPEAKPLVVGRNLVLIRNQMESVRQTSGPDHSAVEDSAWKKLCVQWEQFGLTHWTFGDVPEEIAVSVSDGITTTAFPGLQIEAGQVNLVLFRDRGKSRCQSLEGFQRLVELALLKDLAWLQKDLRSLDRLTPLIQDLCSLGALESMAITHLNRLILPSQLPIRLTRSSFDQAVQDGRNRIPGLVPAFIDRLEEILKARQAVRQRCGEPQTPDAMHRGVLTEFRQLAKSVTPGLAQEDVILIELTRLLPANFLEVIPPEQLVHFPRYLKALLTRAERRKLNPRKDDDRASLVRPFHEVWLKYRAASTHTATARNLVDAYRWMLEEYRVSVFAQELGTAFPVSAKRLEHHLQRLAREVGC